MKRKSTRLFGAACAAAVLAFGLTKTTAAQEPSQDSPAVSPPVAPAHPADGRRHADLPVEAYAVVPGTKFLVRLEDELRQALPGARRYGLRLTRSARNSRRCPSWRKW